MKKRLNEHVLLKGMAPVRLRYAVVLLGLLALAELSFSSEGCELTIRLDVEEVSGKSLGARWGKYVGRG